MIRNNPRVIHPIPQKIIHAVQLKSAEGTNKNGANIAAIAEKIKKKPKK